MVAHVPPPGWGDEHHPSTVRYVHMAPANGGGGGVGQILKKNRERNTRMLERFV